RSFPRTKNPSWRRATAGVNTRARVTSCTLMMCRTELDYSGSCKLISSGTFEHRKSSAAPGFSRASPTDSGLLTQEFIMNDHSTLSRNSYAAQSEVMRNRVLRNTYWLLALSLIPTVLGAFVGLNTGLNAVMATSPGLSVVVFL